MKFSLDSPEPSVEFGDLQFSFRLYTFENTYGLDREQMKVEDKGDGIELHCPQPNWAGGQQKAPGLEPLWCECAGSANFGSQQ